MARLRSRPDVYKAIDSERDYQGKWGNRTHTVTEYILYMEHYLAEARKRASTLDLENPVHHDDVMDFIRKVTALGVVCMEDNGAPLRELKV